MGELAALKIKRLNLLRGTVDVVESMSEINGYLEVERTKTGRPRTLSLPRSLSELLGEHLGLYEGEDGFVFTSAEGKAVAPELLSPPLPTGACPFGSRPEALSMYEPSMRGTPSSALSVPRSAAHVRRPVDRARSPPERDPGTSRALNDHVDVRPLRPLATESGRAAPRWVRPDDSNR